MMKSLRLFDAGDTIIYRGNLGVVVTTGYEFGPTRGPARQVLTISVMPAGAPDGFDPDTAPTIDVDARDVRMA